MIARFLDQVRAEAFDGANLPLAGEFRLAALLEQILARLEESGIFEDCHSAFFHRENANVNAEVHAFCQDFEDDTLSLFFLVDANEDDSFGSTWDAKAVSKEAIDRAFRRLEGFVRLVKTGRADGVEESQPAAELVDLVKECLATDKEIVLCVLTTGTLSERAAVAEPRQGIVREVWDLLRLARICGGSGDEPLSIDFATEFGCELPCLITPKAADGIQVLMTCIPGAVLASVYNTYRSRLLERNVRSFLQFTGKVNKGMRTTLLETPERFLPYNNGLAATAMSVTMREIGSGLAHITAVRDFQIVNGGQTTASIASAARRDKADLTGVSVAMKLTLVPGELVGRLVPLISRYANTQNRVQEADFSANNVWHIAMEKLSRDSWTLPTQDSARGTRWYYERSRGQYADELAAANTPAAKRRFRAENPPGQRFTKTDLAKFVMSWDQRPAVVSRGAQKCFVEFMSQLSRQDKAPPEKGELHRIAAQGILFHAAERLCGELEFKGYRANVVTYAIARLSFELRNRLPWEEIWKNQEIPPNVLQPLKLILLGVRDVVASPPGGRNVTEWCKREECWAAVLRLDLTLSLPDTATWQPHTTFAGVSPSGKPLAQGPLALAVATIPSEVWFSVAKWAKDANKLMPWQRGLAFSVGKLLLQERQLTIKQATQARKLILKAVDCGFTSALLRNELVQQLVSVGE